MSRVVNPRSHGLQTPRLKYRYFKGCLGARVALSAQEEIPPTKQTRHQETPKRPAFPCSTAPWGEGTHGFAARAHPPSLALTTQSTEPPASWVTPPWLVAAAAAAATTAAAIAAIECRCVRPTWLFAWFPYWAIHRHSGIQSA